jgi:hypothetical protein
MRSPVASQAFLGATMPRISEFYGITVYMYWFDNQRHSLPHIHVRYAGNEAVYDLLGNLLEGQQPRRVHRMIEEWCNLRHEDLLDAWFEATFGKEIPWIAPLV